MWGESGVRVSLEGRMTGRSCEGGVTGEGGWVGELDGVGVGEMCHKGCSGSLDEVGMTNTVSAVPCLYWSSHLCVCVRVCSERYAEQLPEISLEGASSPAHPTSSPASSFFGGVLGKRQGQLNRTALCESFTRRQWVPLCWWPEGNSYY